jgi:RNA polymerase sigma-70 factor (ECF subfamily)
LDGFVSSDDQPDAVVVAKEALEQAFIAAMALLPQRQRAVLIVCDVLRWSACETARLLDTNVPAVNSALQQARATLDEHRPSREAGGAPASRLTGSERLLLDRYVDALGRSDAPAVAELVRRDAQGSEPRPAWSLNDTEAVVAA